VPPACLREQIHFAIDPTGQYLLVANQRSDTIVTFRLDEQSGMPVPTGHAVEAPTPVCIRFVPPL
jgi:6-phosphogluconolactonase